MCVCHLLHVQEYSVLPPVHLSMQGRREDSTTAFSVWQGEGKGLATHPCTSPPPTHAPLHPTHSPPHSGCTPTCHTLAPGASSSLILLTHSLPSSVVGASTASLPPATVLGLKGKVASGGSRVWVAMNTLSWVLGHQYHNGSFAGQTNSELLPTLVSRHLAVLLLLPLPPCRWLSLVAFIIFCDGAVWWRRRGGAPAEGWAGWWSRSTAPSNGWISWRRVTML